MADKKINNIMLPTGETLAMPAWASESTMEQVVQFMSASGKVDQKFEKLIDSLGGDIASMKNAVSSLTRTVVEDDNNDKERLRADKEFTDTLVGTARAIDKTSRLFGNAEKPLSGLKEAASSVWNALRNSTLGTEWVSGLLSSNNKVANVAGASIDVAADAFLAFAGWNAAKYEQFAQAQANAIDLGIMLQGGAEAYDTLRHNAQAGGITYTRLMEVAGQYGDAMFGLGETMGTGSQQFADMFNRLNRAADNYGDLGMTSSQMVEAYAEFLSYSRRTGRITRDMNRSAEDINNEFINLQIEAGAIASLTSLSRSEIMRRQMQAFNIQGEAAVFSLREAGLPGQADVASAIIRSLGMLAPESEEIQNLLNVYQQQLMTYKNDMGNFDLNAALGPEMMAAINTVLGENFIPNLEEATQQGTMSANEALSFIIRSFNEADVKAKYSTNSTRGSVADLVRRFQAVSVSIERNFGNIGSVDELEAAITQQRTNLPNAGRVTRELNDMTRRFLEVQELLTVNMSTTQATFDYLLRGMQRSRSVFEQILDSIRGEDNSVNDFGGIEDGEVQYTYDSTGAAVATDRAGNRLSYTPGVSRTGSGDQSGRNIEGTAQGGGVTQSQGGAREDPINDQLLELLSQAGRDTGLNVVVGSGGNEMTLAEIQEIERTQPNRVSRRGSTYYLDGNPVRTGSNRHDHGQAADVVFTDPATGRTLSMANQEDLARIQQFVRRARAYGATGIGAGRRTADGTFDYMGESSVHIGFGSDIHWGDDGSTANSPDWLREIYNNQAAGTDQLPESGTVRASPPPPANANAESVTTPPADANAESAAPAPSSNRFPGVSDDIQDELLIRMSRQSSDQNDRLIGRLRSGELFANHVNDQGEIGGGSLGRMLKDIVDADTVDLNDQQTRRQLSAFADSILSQHNAMQEVTAERPQSRLFGGLVQPNLPYIVGDQLGLQTAELFVPESAGRIVNNRELHNIVSSTLTQSQERANIKDIDLSSLLSSKEETLAAANALRDALQTILRNARTRRIEDIANSR